MRYTLFTCLVFVGILAAAPPQVSQVVVRQDSITFNMITSGNDTLRVWNGQVLFTLFDPDSDWCRITLDINKPDAKITSYYGDTLTTNGQNRKIYFTVTSPAEQGSDVSLKVTADDSLPYVGTITGTTILYGGSPAEYTRMLCMPGQYDFVKNGAIPDSLTDMTDEEGNYSISGIPAGTYSLYGLGFVNFSRLLHSGVTVRAPGIVNAGSDTLYIPGTIKVSSGLLPPFTPDSYIYVPGTVNYYMIDSMAQINNQVTLDSIPPGLIPSINYSVIGTDTTSVLAENIAVLTGDTTVIQK